MIDEDDDGDEEEQEEEGMWRKCGGHTLPTRVFMDEIVYVGGKSGATPLVKRQRYYINQML